jgi:hypothetical protein
MIDKSENFVQQKSYFVFSISYWVQHNDNCECGKCLLEGATRFTFPGKLPD